MEKKYVGILASCSEEIDASYGSTARGIGSVLARNDYNLIFGGSSTGGTGAIYEEFSNRNKDVYLVTTEKYADDAKNMPKAKSIICETTFDLKKEIFENADLIVVLPGGIGTLSELLSFIEERRSNNKTVPIEIYDDSEYYLTFIELLKILVVKKFVSADIFEEFNISHNLDEFLDHINKYREKERIIAYEK